jgi:uncharacterized membrane protein YtjA (UPF0391 family)
MRVHRRTLIVRSTTARGGICLQTAEARFAILAPSFSTEFRQLAYWAVVFLVIAVVAALFGFSGVAGTAMEGAKIIFWIALVLFVISLVFGFMRRGLSMGAALPGVRHLSLS